MTMDILVIHAYVSGMFARVLSILTVLAIAVVTMISTAHAARMDGMQVDHAAHLDGMMHVAADAHPSCDDGQHSGSAEVAICAFVCAGLSALLTLPGVEGGHAFGSADHDVPTEVIQVGRVPGLNERPPKLRLL